jgi:hypothetical protein
MDKDVAMRVVVGVGSGQTSCVRYGDVCTCRRIARTELESVMECEV